MFEMTVSKIADADASPQPQDVLSHLQRALEIADHVGLPPSIGARVQDAIDAYVTEISDSGGYLPDTQRD